MNFKPENGLLCMNNWYNTLLISWMNALDPQTHVSVPSFQLFREILMNTCSTVWQTVVKFILLSIIGTISLVAFICKLIIMICILPIWLLASLLACFEYEKVIQE